MRILIVDNNIDPTFWGSSDLRRFAVRRAGAVVETRRAPHGDLPADRAALAAYDRIVVSGSMTAALDEAPWIANLDALLRRALDLKKPLLGVCYGHQRLAAVLGGTRLLARSKTPEFGWTHIEVTGPSRLFAGLGDRFYSFSSHFDEVAAPPPGTRVCARSETCAVQAYEVQGAPAFGIQFHPEKTLEEGEATLAARRAKGTPPVLLNPDAGHRLFDSAVGEKLFENFFGLGC
jgi:GMP synthase (glutamine-hydrolysing)